MARPDESRGEVFYYSPSLVPGDHALVFAVVDSGATTLDGARIAVQDLRTGLQKTIALGGMSPKVLLPGILTFAGARGVVLPVRF